MSQALGITVDNSTYNVAIEYQSMKRAFEITEGSGKGSAISGKVRLDPVGRYYSYKMKFRALPDFPTEYDRLFLTLSQPVYSHEITLPFGQRTYTFNAMIESGKDTYQGSFKDVCGGVYASYHRWDELEITFTPADPISQDAVETLIADLGGT